MDTYCGISNKKTEELSTARQEEIQEGRQIIKLLFLICLIAIDCFVFWGACGLWVIKALVGVKTFGLGLWSCIVLKVSLGLGLGSLSLLIIGFLTVLTLALIARWARVI